jgi:hypothetical protein
VLKYYVFGGGVALVAVGIVATLLRDRARNKKIRAMEEAAGAAAARTRRAPVASPPAEAAAGPSAAHPEAPYDPNATRIHFRSSPVNTLSELEEREAETLPAEGAARLVCVSGTQKGNTFPLTVAGLKVGRAANNDIVISDPRASNHHAWIGIVDGKALLRDLGSTNGTFLNAHMDSLVSEVALSSGDTIFFGGHGGDQYRFLVD